MLNVGDRTASENPTQKRSNILDVRQSSNFFFKLINKKRQRYYIGNRKKNAGETLFLHTGDKSRLIRVPSEFTTIKTTTKFNRY